MTPNKSKHRPVMDSVSHPKEGTVARFNVVVPKNDRDV